MNCSSIPGPSKSGKTGRNGSGTVQKKLAEVLVNLQVESARLRDHPDCCKIKLKSSGYRLVYQVQDEQLVMLAISV